MRPSRRRLRRYWDPRKVEDRAAETVPVALVEGIVAAVNHQLQLAGAGLELVRKEFRRSSSVTVSRPLPPASPPIKIPVTKR
jgi:hypothetical protein